MRGLACLPPWRAWFAGVLPPHAGIATYGLQGPSPQLFNAWLARIASQLQASWFPTDQRLLPDSHLPTPTTIKCIKCLPDCHPDFLLFYDPPLLDLPEEA